MWRALTAERGQELFIVDLSISVFIDFFNNGFQLGIGKFFAALDEDPFELRPVQVSVAAFVDLFEGPS